MISYGVISTSNNLYPRLAMKMGEKIVDLGGLYDARHLIDKEYSDQDFECLLQNNMNHFIAKGKKFRQNLKSHVMKILENPSNSQKQFILAHDKIKLHMPVKIGGFTDFYASKQHATNIGKIFRPDNPLMPNWVHLPIAYNGRASSVVISDYPLKRPHGQILIDGKPQFSACRKLDFEVEMGIVIGKDSVLGEPIDVDSAHEYVFGICLVNDWSARDIQAWEYQPLGPFTSKSFLTSISPFIVPIEELEFCKIDLPHKQEPQPFSYLTEKHSLPHTYDIEFEVYLTPKDSLESVLISKTNFKYIYWTINQLIAQHTVTGCNLVVGDLIGSGTISGDTQESLGSLMELTQNGNRSLHLSNSETRSFLQDGDKIAIHGYAGTKQRSYIGCVSSVVIGS